MSDWAVLLCFSKVLTGVRTAVWPNWFDFGTQSYWAKEFVRLFRTVNGIDIDGAWINMSEPDSVRSELVNRDALARVLPCFYLLPW